MGWAQRLSLAILLSSACDGGGPPVSPPDDPCSVATTCGECDASACDWCAGRCVTRPDGFDFSDDEWCEWGWVGNAALCDAHDGRDQVESALPVDCRNSRNATEARCDGSATVGEGPAFPDVFDSPEVDGVWVDAASRTLYVAATTRLGAAESVAAVMTVDIDTGDRALLSGTIDDPRTGRVEAGSGPEMGPLMDVAGHPDGGLVVHGERGFFRVMPDGTRTLIQDAYCSHGGFDWNYLNRVSSPAIAVGPDGTIYAALGRPRPLDDGTEPPEANEPNAVAAVDSSGCRVISVASNHDFWRLGEGPVAGEFAGVVLDGDHLYLSAAFGDYFRVDLATGQRLAISNISDGVGSGGEDGVRPGEHGFMLGPDGALWAAGGEESGIGLSRSSITFTEIDIASGDASINYRIGEGDSVAANYPTHIGRHPDNDDWVILSSGSGILVAERTTGNLMVLSR